MELGWLKGLLVSSVGLAYNNCFDLMPQGILFEVCTRLGICPGVQRALEAMLANWSVPLSLPASSSVSAVGDTHQHPYGRMEG